MQESFDHYFEEDSLYQAISRFEDMIKANTLCYFDVCEFEIIIDYYLDQHNFKEAEEAVNVGLSQHPSAEEIKYRLAQLYIQSGKPAKGLRLLREIENLESSNSEFYLLKGSALNLLGRKEEATQSFDEAIRNSTEAKDDIIYNIAVSYINTRRYQLAKKYLMLAFEINPENLQVIHEIALVSERIDDLDTSIKFYNKYLDLDPFNDHIWVSLGMVYSNKDMNELAIDAYDYAIAIDPENISALFSKANTLVNMAENKEAIKTYLEILDLESDNIQAYIYIGECYEKLEFFKRSIYYFTKAIELDEHNADAWYGLGIAYFQQEQFSESLSYFNKAKKLDPENSDFWFMLGEVYRKLTKIEQAANAYNRVIELDPNDFEAWICRAELSYKDNSDLSGAIKILVKSLDFNSEVSTINYHLSSYYFYSNQSRKAISYFDKGLQLNYKEHTEYLSDIPAKSRKSVNSLIKRNKKFDKN
ncbi:MAG: tetratricopeptide repeat protein [Bacteroidales bacterium]|nr:tetratricopeptide repeat protein [Bacteroidales bacterium]MBN2820139.1 tetratricopeptide repeat protein [Bacteroidales bacterium]